MIRLFQVPTILVRKLFFSNGITFHKNFMFYCGLLAAPPKCVMRLENTFCCFPSPQQRRRPAAAAAPCMASQHRKTLCSPIFVFSSHIIIFRWQALQFGFVPSQPSCQSNIICYEHNQPTIYPN